MLNRLPISINEIRNNRTRTQTVIIRLAHRTHTQRGAEQPIHCSLVLSDGVMPVNHIYST